MIAGRARDGLGAGELFQRGSAAGIAMLKGGRWEGPGRRELLRDRSR